MTGPHQFEELLDVPFDRTIQGAVSGGAVVRTGATLTVQGNAAGPYTIEVDAVLTVQGTFFGSVVSNVGTLLIAGMTNLAFEPGIGRVALAVGSLIEDRGELSELRPDGTLRGITNRGAELSVDASVYCFFDSSRRTFRPLS